MTNYSVRKELICTGNYDRLALRHGAAYEAHKILISRHSTSLWSSWWATSLCAYRHSRVRNSGVRVCAAYSKRRIA